MAEPLFLSKIVAGPYFLEPKLPAQDHMSRQLYLLWRAAASAIEGAMRYGLDVPVGAAVGSGRHITGSFFASDKRTGKNDWHAEVSAIQHSFMANYRRPDTLGVNLEPCGSCQEAIACCPTIKTVLFTSERTQLEQRGLVNERPGILQEIKKGKILPYEVVHFEDAYLSLINDALFDNTTRDTVSGEVQVDTERLNAQLLQHPAVRSNGIPFLS